MDFDIKQAIHDSKNAILNHQNFKDYHLHIITLILFNHSNLPGFKNFSTTKY